MATSKYANRYTDEQKSEAVELLRQHGGLEASRRCGIPATTIKKWARKAGVKAEGAPPHLLQAGAVSAAKARLRREQIRVKMLGQIESMLDRMDQQVVDYVGQTGKEVTYRRPEGGNLRAVAVAFGILVDKFRLEMGESTSRSEKVEHDKIDAEVRRMLDEMERRDKAPTPNV